jgi:hypothetical protein
MLGFVIITLCLDYAKLNPYYTIPTIFGGEPMGYSLHILAEVEQCDIYLGLFGNEYGYEDADGLSPTEREFDVATLHH